MHRHSTCTGFVAVAQADRAVIADVDLSGVDEQGIFCAALAQGAANYLHGYAHGHHAFGGFVHNLV